jgi:hypothetical protein
MFDQLEFYFSEINYSGGLSSKLAESIYIYIYIKDGHPADQLGELLTQSMISTEFN